MAEQLPYETSDTPKTDAVAYLAIPALGNNRWAAPKVVPADFARAQERRIAELEERIRHRLAVCNCGGHSKCGTCQDDEVALL